MKKSLKKNILSLVLAVSLMGSAGPSLASPNIIHESKMETPLYSGIVHESVMKFTSAGWWNINVLRVDLTNPYVDVANLVNTTGIPNRAKLTTLIDRNGAVAGINGDFFNYSPVAYALGTMVNKGEIMSSPIDMPNRAPSILMDSLNRVQMEEVKRDIFVVNTRTGEKAPITVVNKVTKDVYTVLLLNKYHGEKTLGNSQHKDLLEIIVEGDVVKSITKGASPSQIPKDGYVLAVRGHEENYFSNYKVGDRLDLNVNLDPVKIDDLKFAMGSGGYLLKNGQVFVDGFKVPGNHPRTGVGISQDGKELILATIDGRGSSFVGVNQEVFGQIMKDLGAFNAVNMDGGGSTTMAIKPMGEDKAKLVNTPSDGGERQVVNGLGLFSNAPLEDLAYLKLTSHDNNMFVNTSRDLIVKGYDRHHNPVDIDESELEFSFSGVLGEINSSSFKALSPGQAIVEARLGDITTSLELLVLDEAMDLITNKPSLGLDPNSSAKLGDFFGLDSKGHKARVYPRDLNFQVFNGVGRVEDGIFYSGPESKPGAISASLGKGLVNIPVSLGSQPKTVNSLDKMDGISFSAYPSQVTGQAFLAGDRVEGAASLGLNYDFTNGPDTRAAYVNFSSGFKFEGRPQKISLALKGDGKGSWFRGTIKDAKGLTYTLDFSNNINFTDFKDLTGNVPSEVTYPISLEKLYVVETNGSKRHKGQLLIDNIRGHYPVEAKLDLPKESSLVDSRNVKRDLANSSLSFGLVIDPLDIDSLAGYKASSNLKSRLNKYNISLVLGGAHEPFKEGISNEIINANNVYGKYVRGDVTIINLDTSKRGIRASNPNQWNHLKNDLNNLTTSNLVLVLDSPVFGSSGFSDQMEADLLHNFLKEIDNKTVFLVHGGGNDKTELIEGVSYIGINSTRPKKAEDLKKLSLVEFIEKDGSLTYTIEKIFK